MLRTAPVFGDPKTDFGFQRIFGSEDHKTAVIGFLNNVLELDDVHRVVSVMLLSPELRPKVSELKYSIIDVKCVDARGTTYGVEMQVFNVEAFEKRVVYNVAKAYTNRLGVGVGYPELDDVIGIRICDFELWPRGETPHVPRLNRWRMQEQRSGVKGLPQLQFVFLELPKYHAGSDPQSFVDKWACFFREAENLLTIHEALQHPPLLDALEGARTARSYLKATKHPLALLINFCVLLAEGLELIEDTLFLFDEHRRGNRSSRGGTITVFAHRAPMLLLRNDESRFDASLLKLPPRITRFEASLATPSGPYGRRTEAR